MKTKKPSMRRLLPSRWFFSICVVLFFRATLVFCSPRGRGKGKPLGELIDEILGRAVSHRVCNVQNFQVGIHQQEGCSVDFLFVKEVDNRLVKVLLKLPANVPMAVRKLCRQVFNRIQEVFRLL